MPRQYACIGSVYFDVDAAILAVDPCIRRVVPEHVVVAAQCHDSVETAGEIVTDNRHPSGIVRKRTYLILSLSDFRFD